MRHVEPVVGQALQAGDAVADFVVENLGATAGDRIESGIAQLSDSVANGEAAVLGDGDDLRRRIAMQMDFRKALLDSPQHALVPVNLQIGMQAALHQHSGATELDRFANFFVDGIELEDVSLFRLRPFQRTVKRAEGAVLSTEIRVIDVSINNVSDHAFRMQLAPRGIGLHADSDQVVGGVEIESLGCG